MKLQEQGWLQGQHVGMGKELCGDVIAWEWMFGHTDRQTHGHMDKWADRQTHGQRETWANGQTDTLVDR